MISLLSSLHFLFLTVFVVFGELSLADNWYKTCSSLLFTCGNLTKIGYPFWGDGRPQNCGHPALQLQCLDNQNGRYPILNIGPKYLTPYHIPNITFFDRNTTIKLQGAPDTPCGSYGEDFGDVLQFSKSIEMINLLYNCTNPIVPHRSDGPTGSITCYQNQKTYFVYYRSNMSSHGKYASCNSGVAPVFRDQLERYNKQELIFSDVVRQGFEVHFEYTSDCIKCKRSGCLCGSSPTSNFRCFCKSGKSKLKLGIAITVGVVILAAVCVCFYYYKKRKSRSPVYMQRMIPTDPITADFDISTSFNGIAVFSYNELQQATNNFDATQELGDGGFGIVYYGKLKDGREVAVKHLYEKSYRQVGQFMNEVEILTRLRHPNLVTLYGCTSHQSKVLLLVYEYVSNGTVADHLHGDRKGSKALTWAIRMRITIKLQGAPDTLCGSYGKDLGNVLQFSKSIEMTNLLYNCTNEIVPNRSDGPYGSNTCYQNQYPFLVYYRSNMSAHGKFASCSSSVAPVFRNELDRYNNHESKFSDVLKHGFEVHFEYTSDCIKCKRSGGLCGSSPTSNFTCFRKPEFKKSTRLASSSSL